MTSQREEDCTSETPKRAQLIWLANALDNVDSELDELSCFSLSPSLPTISSRSLSLRTVLNGGITLSILQDISGDLQVSMRTVDQMTATNSFRKKRSSQTNAALRIQCEWRNLRLIRRTTLLLAAASERESKEALAELQTLALTAMPTFRFLLPSGQRHGQFVRHMSVRREEFRSELLWVHANFAKQGVCETSYSSFNSRSGHSRHLLMLEPRHERDSAIGSAGSSFRRRFACHDPLTTLSTRVVATMRASVANEVEMQLLGCSALSLIVKKATSEADTLHAIGVNGGGAVLRAMRAFPASAALQCTSCGALINLVKRSPTAAKQLANAGAAACVVAAMREHKTSAELLASALAALGFISQHGRHVAEKLITAHVHTETVLAMSLAHRGRLNGLTWSESQTERVLRWGVVVLGNIAQWSADTARHTAQAGAPHCVAQTMRMHPTATKLQCHGAFALRSMAAHDDQTTAAVIEAGGAVALAMALRFNTDREDAVRWGCSALGHMAKRSRDGAKAVAAAGNIDAIVAAMLANPASSPIQGTCCFALYHTVRRDSFSVARQMTASSTRSALLFAVEHHGDDDCVQQWGRKALVRCETLARHLADFIQEEQSALQRSAQSNTGAINPFFGSSSRTNGSYRSTCRASTGGAEEGDQTRIPSCRDVDGVAALSAGVDGNEQSTRSKSGKIDRAPVRISLEHDLRSPYATANANSNAENILTALVNGECGCEPLTPCLKCERRERQHTVLHKGRRRLFFTVLRRSSLSGPKKV
mmetsp:Transcript_17945/g.38802  ORF Transcript_17945/g.38802 Transcript_17945/m.38802 type:complete len:766 (-) Transcript_17945:413-2710(-)